ncbi:hypothetical protein GCM10011504_26920 [Siccirubricoccus deserti]|uniref:hypothetical protein n=1 Tax=Siccirubricoccus deserti TaxID=2013562 RepID=UPI0019C89095|nr:hypothetical protein [Siccirubricoccus deserti]GGC47069.1 hypothetical protein GCM10011504_26920 [Siccirubricoccus deserti]
MRIILAVALAALLPAAPSPAQPAKPRATPAPAAAPHPVSPAAAVAMLPETIAGWRRGAVTDFSPRPGGAGLGAAVEYRPEAGGAGVATVYVYDRGRTRLRDGADSPEVAEELDTALREIDTLGPVRHYRVESRRPATAPPGLRCEAMVMRFEGGVQADSLVCLGVARGRFLKLRLTLPARDAVAAERIAAELGAAMVAASRS